MGVKAESRIGTIINGWKILAVVKRTEDRHVTFQAQSTVSGRIVNARLYGLQHNKYAHRIAHKRSYNKRLTSIFNDMKQRCFNVNIKMYKCYGARGITVCKEWLEDSNSFYEWAFEHGYEDTLTIDRIDVNKGYSPDNCRWISPAENSKWHRNSSKVWIGVYCDTESGWSVKVGKHRDWFRGMRKRHDFDDAYQKLLDRIEELGGIKKVMGISEEEPDITGFLTDIENDCLEVEP